MHSRTLVLASLYQCKWYNSVASERVVAKRYSNATPYALPDTIDHRTMVQIHTKNIGVMGKDPSSFQALYSPPLCANTQTPQMELRIPTEISQSHRNLPWIKSRSRELRSDAKSLSTRTEDVIWGNAEHGRHGDGPFALTHTMGSSYKLYEQSRLSRGRGTQEDCTKNTYFITRCECNVSAETLVVELCGKS